MVLWEITLGTAYFLGLKRTYRLALRIQRRLISPEHPRIRQFLHRYFFFVRSFGYFILFVNSLPFYSLLKLFALFFYSSSGSMRIAFLAA